MHYYRCIFVPSFLLKITQCKYQGKQQCKQHTQAEAATQKVSKHERAAEPLLRPEQLAELRKEAAAAAARARAGGAGAGGGGGKGGTAAGPSTSARFRRNKAKVRSTARGVACALCWLCVQQSVVMG